MKDAVCLAFWGEGTCVICDHEESEGVYLVRRDQSPRRRFVCAVCLDALNRGRQRHHTLAAQYEGITMGDNPQESVR